MSRVQLALNVTSLDEAVAFYSTLFGTQPAKVRPGYANFAIEDPPLKLVLIEGEQGGSLNHLGVEVGSTGEVTTAAAHLAGAGLPTVEESGACCFAEQEKVWVQGPDGEPWEVYTVLGDAEHPQGDRRPGEPGRPSACSATVSAEAATALGCRTSPM